MCVCVSSGFHTEFFAGGRGELFGTAKLACVKQVVAHPSRGSGGVTPPPPENF